MHKFKRATAKAIGGWLEVFGIRLLFKALRAVAVAADLPPIATYFEFQARRDIRHLLTESVARPSRHAPPEVQGPSD
jgi:hypothetical protein